VLLLAAAAGVSAAAQAAAGGPASSSAPAAAPADATLALAQLLAVLAQRHDAQAHFRQTQHLAVLTRALVSEGTLIYRAPDYLEQRVSRPRQEDFILEHGQLTAQLGRHRRTVALADYPQLSPLLDSVRATLAGDQAALEQLFMAQLQGTLAHWQLTLTPRSPQLAVRSIVLRGAHAQILQVHITQTNGDEADMRIEPLAAQSPGEPPE
jgi:hypothetical protein